MAGISQATAGIANQPPAQRVEKVEAGALVAVAI